MIRISTLHPCIAISLAIGITTLLGSCKNHDKPTPIPPTKVDVAVVGVNNPSAAAKVYSGTTESSETSTVSFSVPGTIIDIYTKVGRKVSKGQALARVKSESLVNASNIAQAELAQAQDAYNRLKILHDANALPDIKWVEVQQKLKQAENAAELARRNVNDATITAPISGYVAQKFADEGQNIVPSQPVLSIVDLDHMRIAISVPEEDITKFTNSSKAKIIISSLDSLTIDGTLNQKDVIANPLTRSYAVKFNIPNPDRRILPGMIGEVLVSTDETVKESASTSYELPSQAVLLDSDNRQFVWIVKDGKAIRKYVTADELSPSGVYVRSGLADGDSVIVAGMQKVSTGTLVTTK